MIIDKIKKIELEITSDCNAACPGCLRTQRLEDVKIESFTFEDLKRIFPTKQYIKDKTFKFCGVLGDPALNKECVDMVEYIAYNDGRCNISTNGSIQSKEWWAKLGHVAKHTKNLDINFCIDGHRETNHIYRVNTKFDVIERNVQAYMNAGEGKSTGTWVYIVFDHNEHELKIAKEHAKRLGLRFATRTGMRNSYSNWVSIIKKKVNKKLVEEQTIITTSSNNEHSKVEQVKKLDKFIDSYKNKNSIDNKEKTSIVNSIQCKWFHEGEIFIAVNLKVWPCCFLWSNYFSGSDNIVEKLSKYGNTFNSLKHHSLEEILTHPWYAEVLALSWNPEHNQHLNRCIRTCAYHKAYQNEFKVHK